MHYEGVDIGLLLKHFGQGLPAAVTGLGIYPYELRLVSGVALLEGCGKLEGMGGNHAVVVVGGGDKCGRICRSGLQVMERGIAKEVAEHFLRIL